MNTKLIAACAASAALALATPAMATPITETGTVAVSATLTAACSIGDGTLAFGSFNSLTAKDDGTGSAAVDNDADTGAIDYICSNGANASLTISSANAAGTQLQMKHGTSDLLAYNVYVDGDADTGTQLTPGGDPYALDADGIAKSVTLYGRVPGTTANQKLGDYADTLTLTVSY